MFYQCPQTTKDHDSDKIETLQKQNKILSSTVYHYKQIITDTVCCHCIHTTSEYIRNIRSHKVHKYNIKY